MPTSWSGKAVTRCGAERRTSRLSYRRFSIRERRRPMTDPATPFQRTNLIPTSIAHFAKRTDFGISFQVRGHLLSGDLIAGRQEELSMRNLSWLSLLVSLFAGCGGNSAVNGAGGAAGSGSGGAAGSMPAAGGGGTSGGSRASGGAGGSTAGNVGTGGGGGGPSGACAP